MSELSADEKNKICEALGEVTNTSEKTFRFIQIEAKFLAKRDDVIGIDTTFACSEDEILPGKTKSFKIKGNNDPEYYWVRFTILSASEVH